MNENFQCFLRFAKINVNKGKISTRLITAIYICINLYKGKISTRLITAIYICNIIIIHCEIFCLVCYRTSPYNQCIWNFNCCYKSTWIWCARLSKPVSYILIIYNHLKYIIHKSLCKVFIMHLGCQLMRFLSQPGFVRLSNLRETNANKINGLFIQRKWFWISLWQQRYFFNFIFMILNREVWQKITTKLTYCPINIHHKSI